MNGSGYAGLRMKAERQEQEKQQEASPQGGCSESIHIS
ncbi:hypothetical protein Barb6_03291 [Bacteroidales bacterium Barb6]|nr:hypothetical protein Barb6_03291 [Bacteroidales bacterium Barb6]